MARSKPALHLETSVVGYLAGRVSRDTVVAEHQRITRAWWSTRRHGFDLYCSQLVLDEAASGDDEEANSRLAFLTGLAKLEASEEALALVESLMKRKAMPGKARNDATHLAIAAVGNVDYLLTWNCRHLANVSLVPLMKRVCQKAGWRCPMIVTPKELLEGDDGE